MGDVDSAVTPDQTLAELFEAQAARTPEQPAVACGDSALSYAELDQQASRLAHHLIGLGAGGGGSPAAVGGAGDRAAGGGQDRGGGAPA